MVIMPLLLLVASEIVPGAGAVEFRQPQLAYGHGEVALAYGGGSAIYFASSKDEGKTFSPRVKVAELGALALGRHRGPRVTMVPGAILISAVAGGQASKDTHAHGLPENGDLVVWRSVDEGKSWVRSAVINDVPGAANEGLHAIVADAKGNTFAVWLDKRGAGTQLYGSRSVDGGRTWAKNVIVYASPDGTICQCCDPSWPLTPRARFR